MFVERMLPFAFGKAVPLGRSVPAAPSLDGAVVSGFGADDWRSVPAFLRSVGAPGASAFGSVPVAFRCLPCLVKTSTSWQVPHPFAAAYFGLQYLRLQLVFGHSQMAGCPDQGGLVPGAVVGGLG